MLEPEGKILFGNISSWINPNINDKYIDILRCNCNTSSLLHFLPIAIIAIILFLYLNIN